VGTPWCQGVGALHEPLRTLLVTSSLTSGVLPVGPAVRSTAESALTRKRFSVTGAPEGAAKFRIGRHADGKVACPLFISNDWEIAK
jgi:hypothetical protein